MPLPIPTEYENWQDFANALLQVLTSSDSEVVAGSGGGGVSFVPSGYAPVWIQTGINDLYSGNVYGTAPTAPDIVFIDTAQIANAAITGTKIAVGAVGTTNIVDAAIVSAKIGDLQVVTAKIADLAVNNAKIANLAVGSANIIDLAVTNAKIGLLAVGSANIIDAAILTAKINDLSVVTAKIGAAQITTAKIANAQITNALIANLAVGAANIIDASIGTAKIIDASITSAKIISVMAAQIVAADLSAITATIGILRTASSGARMEIRDNVIKVYDSGGVVRVQIGDLTL